MSADMIKLIYLDKENYKEAYKYMRIAYVGRINYFQKDIDVKMKAMQYDFEIESKQKEINYRNSQLWFLFISFFTLLLLTSLFIVILLRKNKRKKILNEELNKSNQIILRQNEQLTILNSEKDKFFSIIAHDLLGPFNGFLGLTKIMAEESESLTREEIQNFSVNMRDSASNLFRLLENLLEWSRLQRGLIGFEPKSFILMPVFAESMHPVIDSANKKGIAISYEIYGNQKVFADEYMLASILRNLASNAVKFSRKGSTVTITAKPVPGNSVEISVRDTGIGMSSTMVACLFKLDVQTNRKGTDGEPSTGLGLLLCKDFIEKHDGKLWVESEEGKGSTFYFTIPHNADPKEIM